MVCGVWCAKGAQKVLSRVTRALTGLTEIERSLAFPWIGLRI